VLPKIFYSENVIDAGIITAELISSVRGTALDHAKNARLIGGTTTSLESEGTELSYRLMDGNAVEDHIPVLSSLYRQEFRSIAERVFGRELTTSPSTVSGVNINVLEGKGGRYEWHVDSNPFTGLLLLSPATASLGGRLLFGQDPDTQVALALQPGDLLFFDAREAPHAVEELRKGGVRASVPMNYFVEGELIIRPDDLDDSLYGEV
jgi:hypothetical protein